jgi:hypothetical protein
VKGAGIAIGALAGGALGVVTVLIFGAPGDETPDTERALAVASLILVLLALAGAAGRRLGFAAFCISSATVLALLGLVGSDGFWWVSLALVSGIAVAAISCFLLGMDTVRAKLKPILSIPFASNSKLSVLWIVSLILIVGLAYAAAALQLSEEERFRASCLGSGTTAAESSTGDDQGRPSSGNARPGKTAKAGSKKVAVVAVDQTGSKVRNPELTYDFGTERGAETRTQSFLVKPASEEKRISFGFLGPLTDAESGDLIPVRRLDGSFQSSRVVKGGLNLRLCVDVATGGETRQPKKGKAINLGKEVSPGTYEGTVFIGRPSADIGSLATMDVAVIASSTDDWLAMAAVLLGVLVGLAVRIATDLPRTRGEKPDDSASVSAYVLNFRFLFMFAGGLIAGILVYGPLFADKAAATTDLVDALVPLAVAAFTATIAAKSLADLPPLSDEEIEAGLGPGSKVPPEKRARRRRNRQRDAGDEN